MNRDLIHPSFLLLLVFLISAVFLVMIKSFLMAIFLAGIFSALAHPLYRRLNTWMRGRKTLASALTILIIVLMVLLPLSGLLGIVTSQAIKVGQSATPWVQEQLASPVVFSEWLERVPFYENIEPYRGAIFKKAGELVGGGKPVSGLRAPGRNHGHREFYFYHCHSALHHVFFSHRRHGAPGKNFVLHALR